MYCVRMGGLWEIARILPCVCTQDISSFGHLHARSGPFGQDLKESWLLRAEKVHESSPNF